MIVKLNGKEIDLSRALPLKIKDWKALEKHGVNAQTAGTFEHMAKTLFHVLHKADSSITEEMVEDLEPNDPIVGQVFEGMVEKRIVSNPTLTPSISSVVITDGASVS